MITPVLCSTTDTMCALRESWMRAARITFPDPANEERAVSVEAALPEDFARTLKQLAKVRAPRR